MQNENKEVEIVSEPKIETRFGFQGPNKSLSPTLVRTCIIGAFISLGTVLVIKSPDKPEIKKGSGVKVPNNVFTNASSQVAIESYSLEQENNSIKEKGKKKITQIVVKLPGLQKIDRTRSGQIPPGSEVKARLLTGASNGLVRAEILENLKIHGETFVSAGDTLIGQGQSTEERLFIRFSNLIHPDGKVETVQAQVADMEDKTAGLKGSKFGRYALKYGAAVGLNFIGGMTEGLQDRTIVGQQVVTAPTTRNALLNGANKAAIEMATDQMNQLRNQPPPITVDAGQEVLIIFETNQ